MDFYHRNRNEGIFEGIFIVEIKTKGFLKGFLKPTKHSHLNEMHYLLSIFRDLLYI